MFVVVLYKGMIKTVLKMNDIILFFHVINKVMEGWK